MRVANAPQPATRGCITGLLTGAKGGGSSRMIEIAKRERFYQQEYCGCAYSLRDTNRWRTDQGRNRIKIGVQYYGD